MARSPRLRTFDYRGGYRYSWTLCAYRRYPVFVDGNIVESVRSHFDNTRRGDVDVLAYCFMPDHVHFVLESVGADAPITAYVSRAKQASGFWFARHYRERLWQKSSYDRVLRSDEDTMTVIRYELDNPVRAGIVERAVDYQFSGSMLWTREELFKAIEISPG